MPHQAQPISRQKFLHASTLALSGAVLSSFASDFENKNTITIGLCGSWKDSALAKQSGCSYIEEGVAKILMPTKSEQEFREQLKMFSDSQPLKIEVFNLFLPGEMKVVGDLADHEVIINYASVAFQRMERVGAKMVVFGSGGARRIPEGFEKSKAKEQFVALCKRLAPLAAQHNITMAVEQLNRGETNFINTLREAGEIVDAVNHPNLKMICDMYHALKENDPASELVRLSNRIVHCHIAEREGRTPPGVKGDDFTPYFKALKEINYQGRISLECRWKNMETELPIAVKALQEQFAKA